MLKFPPNDKPKKQIFQFLKSVNNIINPFSHSNSVEGLFQNARSPNQNHLEFSREDVRQFLASQKSFNSFQPIDKTQLQQKVPLVVGRFVKWEMDLVDMKKYAEQNDGSIIP